MKKIISTVFYFSILFLFASCNSTMNSTNSKSKLITNSVDLEGDSGILLRIEIEYTISGNGFLNNDCRAFFTITNIGNQPYIRTLAKKDHIVFEFTASDGKIFEKSQPIWADLQPGKTASTDNVSIDAGMNRYCKSVKAVRMDN